MCSLLSLETAHYRRNKKASYKDIPNMDIVNLTKVMLEEKSQ